MKKNGKYKNMKKNGIIQNKIKNKKKEKWK